MHAAIRSNIPRLSEFDAWSGMDKAYLIQYWRTRDAMEAWENEQTRQEIERQNSGNRKR